MAVLSPERIGNKREPPVALKSARDQRLCSRCRGVVLERFITGARIVRGSAIFKERRKTGGRVKRAGCDINERLVTISRVLLSGCETKKGLSSLSGVPIGVASVRWRTNRLRCGRKREAREHERDEKESAPRRRAASRISDRWNCRFDVKYLFIHRSNLLSPGG